MVYLNPWKKLLLKFISISLVFSVNSFSIFLDLSTVPLFLKCEPTLPYFSQQLTLFGKSQQFSCTYSTPRTARTLGTRGDHCRGAVGRSREPMPTPLRPLRVWWEWWPCWSPADSGARRSDSAPIWHLQYQPRRKAIWNDQTSKDCNICLQKLVCFFFLPF